MLATPDAALGGAGQPTSRRTELLADWIELAALFEDVEIYRHNIRDRLTNAYFVRDEDDASTVVNDAWRSLNRRMRHLEERYPFEITRDLVTLKADPNETYLFLLLLSSPEYFSSFSLSRGGGYRNVFELVTIEAVRSLLPKWNVSWAGATSPSMRAAGGVAAYIAGLLNTKVQSLRHFANAQDGGIDFIAVFETNDGRTAGPAFWGQCATGLDWKTKLEQPSFTRWKDAIRVLTQPVRAFAVPFVFDDDTWDFASITSHGWVIDRERLAKAIPMPLDARLLGLVSDWLKSEVPRLPTAA